MDVGFPAVRVCYQNVLCLSSGTEQIEMQGIPAFRMHMAARDGASMRRPKTPRQPLCPDYSPGLNQHTVITASRAVPAQEYADFDLNSGSGI